MTGLGCCHDGLSTGESWLGVLLPVLDQFVAGFEGNVDHGFWQSMVKLRNTGGGSGAGALLLGALRVGVRVALVYIWVDPVVVSVPR